MYFSVMFLLPAAGIKLSSLAIAANLVHIYLTRGTELAVCGPSNPEKVRYKVIGVEMKGMESSMKLVALGATQRRG